ncbi:DivIVA domain-containing protein [Peptacetobacter hominis]|uniref:DivIVA domain-containing protein n=1 Tax=Peptacetobacter hominis TaxID=2743610 RepID=A0A544QUU0_9FIRM|nr:DivIVA domain-containing protein [Peptacetobacter hominis]TQQ84449.1 DivIVA domain-containing protein [Peptacetobacter hominis]
MITPQEIEEKVFKKSVRGFNCDEVYDFLDRIKVDYESLMRENEALRERVKMYNEQLDKYTNIEDTLKETLITAQTAAEDTTSAANKKARIIVEEAEFRGKQRIDEANGRVIEIRKEYDNLLSEFKIFKNKFTALLEGELRNIDEMCSNIDTTLISKYEWRSAMESYDEEESMHDDGFEVEDDVHPTSAMEIEIKEEEKDSPESIFNI